MRVILLALALLLGGTLPAGAQVAMTGTFTAAKACPATTRIHNAKDDGTAVAAGQQYALAGANRTPPTHYLVVIPGASPDKRWVAIGCGTLGTGTAPTLAATSPGSSTTKSLSPRHFVLAISWEPGFCALNAGKPECQTETPASFEASHFTLHGLWPDPNEYCGASRAEQQADKAGDWASLPAPQLSAATRARLDQGMPGTQSDLERHEWLKHGTCAGTGADAYFGRELDFLAAINASPVQQLFAGATGSALTLDDIRAAFDKAFGADAGQRIRVACERQGGDRLITEITIGLYGDVMGQADLPTLIAASRPTNGGCDRGRVTAVR
ncbi:MAG TPA: ribonuclease T2 [Devosia sp.]|nr:ribonuclease T2 [Devosia sp.]